MVRLFEFDKQQVLPQLARRVRTLWEQGKREAEERQAYREREVARRRALGGKR